MRVNMHKPERVTDRWISIAWGDAGAEALAEEFRELQEYLDRMVDQGWDPHGFVIDGELAGLRDAVGRYVERPDNRELAKGATS